METPRIYVGTYAKYNAGSIVGTWLNLSDYAGAEEFLNTCIALHNDEVEPELMFQDSENIPARLFSESMDLSQIEAIYDYIDTISLIGDNVIEAYNAYIDRGYSDNDFEEAYVGNYSSERDFADELVDESGFYDLMEKNGFSPSYFDLDSYTRDLFMSDYWYNEKSRAVFRNI